MSWKSDYDKKIVSALEAVSHIKSNNFVVIGHGTGEPIPLTDAMVENCEQYENVMTMNQVDFGEQAWCREGMEKHFVHNSFFCGKNQRAAINEGRGVFTPSNLSEVPRFFLEGLIDVDVALVQVSPPDCHGYCSFGVSVDFTKAGAEMAKIVIAEVNQQMPRTLGDCFIHVSDIDYIVETDRPLIYVENPETDDIDKVIGEYCASLVEDGSTIQLGIGSMPDAVASFLKTKKNLGIHTELMSEAMIELVESGAVNGKMKTFHPGKIVATCLFGTKKLYDYVDDNPLIEMHPSNYTNDPRNIAKNRKMVSINGCIQVDLMGQTASEMIGSMQYSGSGGQNDYLRGIALTHDGKAILCMRSTAKNGSISKIVSLLDTGASVTNTRNDAHYIITEYGIANLRAKSLPDRAKALINIAHPDFRAELTEEFEKRFKKSFN